jgi:NAD(P)-dependent dehydrogenase (short-subunit alcohol dehydrogenase family)
MKSQFNLNGKVIVVTGGAGLLGRTFVKSTCQAGATAVIAEHNIDIALRAKEELNLELSSAKIEAIEMDITSKPSIKSAINTLARNLGSIDALVNNAYPRNPNYGKSFFEVEYDDFCENVGMNLGGYFLTSQQFANYFKTRKSGNIINVSSIYGVIAPRFEIYDGTEMTMPVEYAAIKSGLIHLTKYMCKYLKGTGIRVNTLSPGGIFDHQNPSFISAYNKFCANKGMLTKEDMNGSLMFLLSDDSQFVNGQNLIVDDGFTL